MKLAHDRILVVVPWIDQTLEGAPISSVLDWVLNTIDQVSEVLGLSFEGLEYMA